MAERRNCAELCALLAAARGDFCFEGLFLAVGGRNGDGAPAARYLVRVADGGAAGAAGAAAAGVAAAAATSTPTIFDNESCFWFDASGTIFAKAYDTEGSALFAVHDYSQTGLGLAQSILPSSPAAFVANFISILNVVKQSGLTVKEIALRDVSLQEIDVSTYNGPDVYFSLRFDASDDLQVLQSLMAKPGFTKLQYVDFRVENRAYYK